MRSPLRSSLLALLVLVEVLVMGRAWQRQQAQHRSEVQSCTSIREGVSGLLGGALAAYHSTPDALMNAIHRMRPAGEPVASDGHPMAVLVDRYMQIGNIDRSNPLVPDRPLARRVHGLNFVPGPEMHCTVFVLTDPAPGSNRILLRQYLEGRVFESTVEPTTSPDIDPARRGVRPAA